MRDGRQAVVPVDDPPRRERREDAAYTKGQVNQACFKLVEAVDLNAERRQGGLQAGVDDVEDPVRQDREGGVPPGEYPQAVQRIRERGLEGAWRAVGGPVLEDGEGQPGEARRRDAAVVDEPARGLGQGEGDGEEACPGGECEEPEDPPPAWTVAKRAAEERANARCCSNACGMLTQETRLRSGIS